MNPNRPEPSDDPAVDAAAIRLLSAGLATGVRTPLHSLLGFSELLAMSDLDGGQHELVEQLITGAEEVLTACDRLTSLLGLLTGQAAPPAHPFPVAELLGEVTTAASPSAPVAVRVEPWIPAGLVADQGALQDVLVELVANAVRHGRGPVTLSVSQAGPAGAAGLPLRFTVTDAGPGLPPGDWSEVGVQAPVDGRRIGLYLARLQSDRLGGRLTAASNPEGGAEFTLAVTLRPAVAEPAATAGAAGRGPALRVLLVEDNTVNRILAERQFAQLGHELQMVTDGAAGVAAALAGEYDLVLMDRHLPDIDGLEATRRIRAAEGATGGGRRLPIVAVTADASPGHREDCLAAGMDGFLTKPIDLDRLRAMLTAFTPAASTPAVTNGDRDGMDPEAVARLAGRLADHLDADHTAATALLRVYLDELPGRRLRLQGALRRANRRQAVAAADSLRSASLTVGALGVAQVCARIAVAVKGGDFSTGHQALAELRDACERAVAVLAPLSTEATLTDTGRVDLTRT